MNTSNNEELRAAVRQLKWQYKIPYKTIADKLGITQHSLYNWCYGTYDFSYNTIQRLKQIINELRAE